MTFDPTVAYDWRHRSKCRDMHGIEPNDPFFPTKGGNAATVAKMAKAICNGKDGFPVCPVRQECLLWALENNERFGIWGGMSDKERVKLKRKPRRLWKPPTDKPSRKKGASAPERGGKKSPTKSSRQRRPYVRVGVLVDSSVELRIRDEQRRASSGRSSATASGSKKTAQRASSTSATSRSGTSARERSTSRSSPREQSYLRRSSSTTSTKKATTSTASGKRTSGTSASSRGRSAASPAKTSGTRSPRKAARRAA